jgi:hypothetical protein
MNIGTRTAFWVANMTTSTGSRRLSYPWTALLVAALCAPGCGDDHADLTGFDVNLCAGNWRVVHSPRQDAVTLPPRDLAWHGGLLYSLEPLSAGPPFFSVSPADGNRSTLPVPERDIWSYWLEDDRLIYVVGQRTMTGSTPQASLSLFAWPLAGGAAEKLFDASVWASQFIPRLGGMALDREAFHWTEMAATPAGGREWTLWRNPRTGGDAVRLAVVGRPKDDLTGFDGLLPLDDRIIAYSSRLVDGMAWAIPRAGGEARPLPSWPGANIVGAGSDGALLWQRSLDTFNGQRGGAASPGRRRRRAALDRQTAGGLRSRRVVRRPRRLVRQHRGVGRRPGPAHHDLGRGRRRRRPPPRLRPGDRPPDHHRRRHPRRLLRHRRVQQPLLAARRDRRQPPRRRASRLPHEEPPQPERTSEGPRVKNRARRGQRERRRPSPRGPGTSWGAR